MNAPRRGLCATRALKNLNWLRRYAPQVFQGAEPREGWGSVIPVSLLAQLHRTVPDHFDGPLDLEQVRRLTFPRLQVSLPESVFNGTIYFVQVNFRSLAQPTATVPTADMNTAIDYTMTALPQILAYVRQYGPITITINPTMLSYDVLLIENTYSDKDVAQWVNQIAAENSLPGNSCVAILNPAPGATTVINTDCDLFEGLLRYPPNG
jgi:hypothetical protein